VVVALEHASSVVLDEDILLVTEADWPMTVEEDTEAVIDDD
jgi:uncharacterized protein (DUF1778 family)